MANVKTLRKHYDKLNDMERLRLAAAAFQRDDESELRALWETAPRATYDMTAWPFRGMWRGLHVVAWAAVTDVLLYGYSMALTWGWWMRDMLGADDDDDGDGEGLQENAGKYISADGQDLQGFNLFERAVEAAKAVLVIWDGLALFCEELGIPVDQALCQAPCVGMAEAVVEKARRILEMDKSFRGYLAADVCDLEEGDMDKIQEEVGKWHNARVKECAADFRKIWNLEVE